MEKSSVVFFQHLVNTPLSLHGEWASSTTLPLLQRKCCFVVGDNEAIAALFGALFHRLLVPFADF